MSYKNYLLLLSVALLFVLGVSMIFNTRSGEMLDYESSKGSVHYTLGRQLVFALIGVVLGLAIFLMGYKLIIKKSGLLLLISTMMLLAVFLPGIGVRINGAYRWLNIAGFSFQPSEFVKYLLPFYYIKRVTSQSLTLKDFLLILSLMAVPVGLILIEPDHGSFVLILSSFIILFILTRIEWKYWLLPLFVFVALGVVIASQKPHVRDRIYSYFHPELDLQGKGHQPYQAKIAIGSGGFWGKGLGESMQKMNYLPYAYSDYIAAIFGEEFGFIGMFGLILLYMLIGYAGFSIALEAETTAAFYTASILTYLIIFQAFINLGVTSGLLPSKGTNLPFFSQGGSSLIANIIAAAIILNIGSHKRCNYGYPAY